MRTTVFAIMTTAAFGCVRLFAQTPTAPGVPYRGGTLIGRPPTEAVHVSWRIRTAAAHPDILTWRLGLRSSIFARLSVMEAAAKADELGLGFIEGVATQKVSPQLQKNLDYNLTPEELTPLKNTLRALNLRMPAYYVDTIGADEDSRRKLFTFVKALSVETIVCGSEPASLAELDKLANQVGVNVAIESRQDPGKLMSALADRSKRIGVSGDVGAWMESGIKPLDALAVVKDRLMALNLSSRSAPEDATAFFREMYRLGLKPMFFTVDATGAGDTFDGLSKSIDGFEKAVGPVYVDRIRQVSRNTPTASPDRLAADVKDKIASALPREAAVKPKKPRKLLVMDLCVGDIKHSTILHTNLALDLMAKNTGAYEAVFSNDLNNLKYDQVRQFDAVFLNNTSGQALADPEAQQGLVRYLREGGGLAAIHGVSWIGRSWPELATILGTEAGPHRVEKGTLKIDDPASPLNKAFGGKGFEYTDELYLYYADGPYTRNNVHVLFSLDTNKMDLSTGPYIRKDNDYGLSWIKSYGRGRVFNCALGHTPTMFTTPALAAHILAAIQFVLGDLDADTTPTGKLEAMKK